MLHVISIDWFAVYGLQALPLDMRKDSCSAYTSPGTETQDFCETKADRLTEERARATIAMVPGHYERGISIEVQQYGTRQFSMLARVYVKRDLFGFLQMLPRTSVFPRNAMIFKVANKWLYTDTWREQLQQVFKVLHLRGLSISRLDIAADFNRFDYGAHPVDFIRQFMSGEIKHKGRGAGHVDFVQRYAVDQKKKSIADELMFNALTIGKKSSDAHCYLYNKTLELQQETDKPYIRELWQKVGLNVSDVWRLEVTLDRKALIFVDKFSGQLHRGLFEDLMQDDFEQQISALYYSFVHSLFFFFKPTGQKNVSREEELCLFGDQCQVQRGALSVKGTSTRADRIFIKKLYMLANTRGGFDFGDLTDTQRIALKCADLCALNGWLAKRMPVWVQQESAEYKNEGKRAHYAIADAQEPVDYGGTYKRIIMADAMERAIWDAKERQREERCRRDGTEYVPKPFVKNYA